LKENDSKVNLIVKSSQSDLNSVYFDCRKSADWRTIGTQTKYFRSKWEANYARYLQYLKEQGKIKDWLHEPKTFWFETIRRGTRSYKPDFQVFALDGSHEWIEVKGFLDGKSKTKLKRMRIYYPREKITVIDRKFFQKNNRLLKGLIKDYE
jgi:hypothetical protein